MSQCKYPDKFYGKLLPSDVHPCTRVANDSGYCIFHDKDYLNSQTETSLLNEFQEIFAKSIASKTKLDCEGFILPSLNLSGKNIEIPLKFDHAEFKGITKFDHSIFHGKFSVSYATFSEAATFDHSTFHESVLISNTLFKKMTSFLETVFNNRVDFGRTIFEGDAYFGRSTFKKLTYFWKSFFKENAFFYKTEFGEVDFTDCRFRKMAGFTKSVFTSLTDLRGHFDGITYFTNVEFPKNEKVVFDNDVSFISFYETHLGNNVRFVGPPNRSENYKIFDELVLEVNHLSPKLCQRILCTYDDRFCAYDKNNCEKESIELKNILWELENLSEEDKKFIIEKLKIVAGSMNLEDLIAEYANLRENFEYHQKYDISGKLFVRESELRRLYNSAKSATPKNSTTSRSISNKNWFDRSFSFGMLYKVTANYGESYRRPLLIVSAIFVASWAYFSYTAPLCTTYFEYLAKGFSDALSSIMPTVSPLDRDSWSIVIKAISIPLEAVSLIGFKRRFERKFRN